MKGRFLSTRSVWDIRKEGYSRSPGVKSIKLLTLEVGCTAIRLSDSTNRHDNDEMDHEKHLLLIASACSKIGESPGGDIFSSRKYPRQNAWGLLLRPAGSGTQFERIGLLEVQANKGGVGAFKGSLERLVRII